MVRRSIWLLTTLLALTACSESSDGERRFRYAEVLEVPVAVTERDRLAALLAGFAQREGLAFHDTSPRAQRLSNGHQTLALTIQRPLTNGRLWDEIEVSAEDNAAVLVTFAEPLEDGIAADSHRGRSELTAELRRQWPGTREIMLRPDGGLPSDDRAPS